MEKKRNLWVIPTEKPSRLFEDDLQLYYSKDKNRIGSIISNQHIYITSDEEIKEGDWYLNTLKNTIDKCDGIISQKNVNLSDWLKKIILTTDQDLIKAGVWGIEDGFLEWFVKNPSCEEVETVFNNRGITGAEKILKTFGEYKIIIPKEENFKHELHELSKEEVLANRSSAYEFIDFDKQETLEEAAEKWVFENNSQKWSNNDNTSGDNYGSFIAGAKWQQERMYSEMDIVLILSKFRDMKMIAFSEWFEKFRKK